MKKTITTLAVAAALVICAAAPAEANINLRPTAPVYYLGPYYGWPAWCGLIGWRVESNGQHMNTAIIIGSVTDAGGGSCATNNTISAADMDGTLIIRTAGLITCLGQESQLTTPNYFQGSNTSCLPHIGWNTVQVVAHWRLRANGANLTWTSPEFPVYIT